MLTGSTLTLFCRSDDYLLLSFNLPWSGKDMVVWWSGLLLWWSINIFILWIPIDFCTNQWSQYIILSAISFGVFGISFSSVVCLFAKSKKESLEIGCNAVGFDNSWHKEQMSLLGMLTTIVSWLYPVVLRCEYETKTLKVDSSQSSTQTDYTAQWLFYKT